MLFGNVVPDGGGVAPLFFGQAPLGLEFRPFDLLYRAWPANKDLTFLGIICMMVV